MTSRMRTVAVVGFAVALFLGVQFGALVLVEPFEESGRQAVENPEDPTNPIVYFAVILVATGIMLTAFRFGAHGLIQALIVGVAVLLSWFVIDALVPPAVTLGGVNVLAVAAAFGVGAGLVVYPEWYVIDLAGVLMGAGAAGLFGISFGLLPAVVFLVVLAVYDAISVYRTEHMLDLADEVVQLRVPVLFVVPTTRSFSFLAEPAEATGAETSKTGTTATTADGGGAGTGTEEGGTGAEAGDDVDAATGDAVDEPTAGGELSGDDQRTAVGDRDALFIGLGDAVIPTILVASAVSFLSVDPLDVPLISLNVPALGAMIGTLAGLFVLLAAVFRGRAHAGLPFLNGGAIGGYLLAAVASGVPVLSAIGL